MKKLLPFLLILCLAASFAMAEGGFNESMEEDMEVDYFTPAPTLEPGTTATPVVTEVPVTPVPAWFNPDATAVPQAEYTLPIDFSAGMKPWAQGLSTDGMSYEDPTISVVITKSRAYETDYWVADIRIADASQLRTAAASVAFADSKSAESIAQGAGAFDQPFVQKEALRISDNVNAVLALNGDSYGHLPTLGYQGYILRQGKLFFNSLNGKRDVLLIDEDGDFHGVPLAQSGAIGDTIEGKKIINSLCFGPILVDEGKVVPYTLPEDMAEYEGRRRMCIAQVSQLHYKVIGCMSNYRGNVGMTLGQFAEIVAGEGVRIAYNLDGGESSYIILCGKKINTVEIEGTRPLWDIIYFASALPD